MFKFTLLVIGAVLLATPSLAKTFDRCSLAREMHRLGTPKDELSRWTCIALHESNYNTDAVGTPNYNGSRDYGIFQINDLYWCKPPTGAFSYNECDIDCNSFLVESIEPAVKCARKVLDQQGWSAWSTWHFCDGKLESIDHCFK